MVKLIIAKDSPMSSIVLRKHREQRLVPLSSFSFSACWSVFRKRFRGRIGTAGKARS